MQHPRWREGGLSTGFIAEEFPDGFKAPQPAGRRRARAWRRSAPPSTISHNERKRQISGQMRPARDRVASSATGSVMLGRERLDVRGRGRATADIAIVIDGEACAGRDRDWRPGEPVWRGTVGGEPSAVQVRPLLNGFQLSHAGAVGGGAGLHRARGGTRGPDAGEGWRPTPASSCFARCRAWSRPSCVQGRPGGEGRRTALHRRGHEDGERAARRARRAPSRRSTRRKATASRSTP